MITVRDHQTGDLFDPGEHLGEKRRRLLDRSRAAVFREHLLNHLPVAELAARFSRELGRPTKDLHAVVGALIRQQLHDTTDAATVEAVALNLAWQHALDIRAEADASLCGRTLRNYRKLLIGRGLDQVLFRSFTDRLIKGIGVDTTGQRLDSTAIRSAMRGLTRLGIMVESISEFLRELRRCHPDLHGRVDPETVQVRRSRGRRPLRIHQAARIEAESARGHRRPAGPGHAVPRHRGVRAGELPASGRAVRGRRRRRKMTPPGGGLPGGPVRRNRGP